MEAEAAKRGRKERVAAAVGHAGMGMEVDEGAEVEEAIEDGEIGGEGSEAEEEVGEGDGTGWEEDGAFEGKGARTLVSAGSRGSRRGRGRGGFHHRAWHGDRNLPHHKLDIFSIPGVYGGAIILCNHVTKLESFKQKLFALPDYATSFIRKIRAGMLLFVFEREEKKLSGVFEATSDGALNILPNAFHSLRKPRPAQVRFRRVWFCKPLMEAEFSDEIKGLQPQMSFFGISYQQVLNLVHLFSSKRISLEPYKKPKSRVISDYNVSLARAGLGSSLHTGSNAFPSRSSSMLCNNRISAPHSPLMYGKQNAKHAAYNYESSLHPHIKSVIFKAPDIKAHVLEPNADFIPLDLDDCKSDTDAVPSDILGPAGLYLALPGSIINEDQDPEPFKVKHNEDDMYPAPVLSQSFHSLCETSQNSAIAHFMKERQSSMQGRGCKRMSTLQFDGHSHLPSPRSSTIAKKVSFSFDGDEISVTSDKALYRPALAELKQNREAVTKERKQQVSYTVQGTQSKSGDDSEKRSKLMSLSFAERVANLRVKSCFGSSQTLLMQSSKLSCTLLPDEE
uniref:DCD domain-containing protein n=2 Tax=Hordeum vulgare subsp. vulgare TaxID=112509 RepID=A0A8I6YJK1_HORVV